MLVGRYPISAGLSVQLHVSRNPAGSSRGFAGRATCPWMRSRNRNSWCTSPVSLIAHAPCFPRDVRPCWPRMPNGEAGRGCKRETLCTKSPDRGCSKSSDSTSHLRRDFTKEFDDCSSSVMTGYRISDSVWERDEYWVHGCLDYCLCRCGQQNDATAATCLWLFAPVGRPDCAFSTFMRGQGRPENMA